MTEHDDAPDEPTAPPVEPTNPGTILIPEGHTRLPDDLRPRPDQGQPEGAGEWVFPRFDGGPAAPEPSPHPSFPPLPTAPQPPVGGPPTAAGSSRPPAPAGTSSAPSWPTGPAGTSSAPSWPTTGDAQLDTDARRRAIERRYRRRRLVVLGAAVGIAAVLVGAALLVLAQRGDDARSDEEQVLAVHADALASIVEANEPVLGALTDLARQEMPDLSRLAAPAAAATDALADLPIPASDGDQGHLGRNISAAITAEVAFLDDLEALSAVAVEDVSSVDLDALRSDAEALRSALFTAYGDQPSLTVPRDVDELGSRVEALISSILTAGDVAREVAGLLGELQRYETAVRDVLADLEAARDVYEAAAPGRKTVSSDAEYLAAISAVDQAISARQALAARLDDLTPFDGLENAHGRIADGLRGLADSLYNVKSAIEDVDCRNPYDDDPPPECKLVNTSRYFLSFTEESTAAAHDYDAAVASWEAELERIREDLG